MPRLPLPLMGMSLAAESQDVRLWRNMSNNSCQGQDLSTFSSMATPTFGPPLPRGAETLQPTNQERCTDYPVRVPDKMKKGAVGMTVNLVDLDVAQPRAGSNMQIHACYNQTKQFS
jgi:hypothetical protein